MTGTGHPPAHLLLDRLSDRALAVFRFRLPTRKCISTSIILVTSDSEKRPEKALAPQPIGSDLGIIIMMMMMMMMMTMKVFMLSLS